jgi:GT2 family glycosyltransferase
VKAPDVSVLVVSYRSREDLPACLGSLGAAAGGLDLETVVVDNASRDGSVEMLREGFPEARLIVNDANRGFAAAVNQAAAVARGRHLLLLNPDASPAPGCVAALVEALASRPRAGLAGAQLVNPDGTPQTSAWLAPSLATLAFEALFLYNLFPGSRLHGLRPAGPEPAVVDTLSGACLLVDRELYSALGGLDEGFFLYFEDTDLCLRARSAGRAALLCPSARALHRVGGSAFQDRRDFFLRFHESRRRFLRKQHPGLGGSLMRGAHLAGLALRVPVYAIASVLGGGAALRERAGHNAAALRHLRGTRV